MSNLTVGTRVELITFHGVFEPLEPVSREEDYWILVGEGGVVASEESKTHPSNPDKGVRVLIKFDKPLCELELINHNEVSNALWIYPSDLKVLG